MLAGTGTIDSKDQIDAYEVIDSSESVQKLSDELKKLELKLGFSTVSFRNALLSHLESIQIDWDAVESDLSESDIGLLFHSLYQVSFYNVDHSDVVRQLYTVFQIAEKHDRLSRKMVYRMYESAAKARLLDIANQVNSRYLSNPAISIEDTTSSVAPDSRTILINDDNAYSMIRESLPVGDQWFALLFDPWCGPSMHLLQKMVSQPDVLAELTDHGIL